MTDTTDRPAVPLAGPLLATALGGSFRSHGDAVTLTGGPMPTAAPTHGTGTGGPVPPQGCLP